MEKPRIWPKHLFRGNATSWIKDKAKAFCHGDGIDFGAGKWCLPGAIPVDHETYFGIQDFDAESLDFIYSSHCLEHIICWKWVLKELISKLKPGGVVFLYLPHEISPWTNWRKHKWTPTPTAIINAFEELGIKYITHTDRPDDYQSFFVIGSKRLPQEEAENK